MSTIERVSPEEVPAFQIAGGPDAVTAINLSEVDLIDQAIYGAQSIEDLRDIAGMLSAVVRQILHAFETGKVSVSRE